MSPFGTTNGFPKKSTLASFFSCQNKRVISATSKRYVPIFLIFFIVWFLLEYAFLFSSWWALEKVLTAFWSFPQDELLHPFFKRDARFPSEKLFYLSDVGDAMPDVPIPELIGYLRSLSTFSNRATISATAFTDTPLPLPTLNT